MEKNYFYNTYQMRLFEHSTLIWSMLLIALALLAGNTEAQYIAACSGAALLLMKYVTDVIAGNYVYLWKKNYAFDVLGKIAPPLMIAYALDITGDDYDVYFPVGLLVMALLVDIYFFLNTYEARKRDAKRAEEDLKEAAGFLMALCEADKEGRYVLSEPLRISLQRRYQNISATDKEKAELILKNSSGVLLLGKILSTANAIYSHEPQPITLAFKQKSPFEYDVEDVTKFLQELVATSHYLSLRCAVADRKPASDQA